MKARRAYLTKRERAEMIARQGGLCFTFGCDGKPEIGEHFTPVALGNSDKPDCLLCKACAKEKTRRDVKAIAKVKRIRNGKTQADKRAAKGSRMKSRGFDKSMRKHMDGSVSRRPI